VSSTSYPFFSSTGQQHVKLTKLVFKGFFDLLLNRISSRLRRLFFLRGPSSSGMSEESYSQVIYDMNLAAAHTLVRLNPTTTFTYVSGAGTDSTEQRRTMGAGVKGKTGNALLRLPCKAAHVLRPAGIQPLHGIKSRTASYRILYTIAKPVFPLLKLLLPNYITTTEQFGRAMIHVAQNGFPKPVLEARDINKA